MQTVSAAFTAEEKDPTRRIAHNLQVSWKKFSTLGSRLFTIGVSTIGGTDVIGINPGAIGSPSNYQYFDESDYVTSLAWERGLRTPIGGLTKALAEAELDNTSGRFTPRYMGGSSELFTAILPRRPMIIQAGFEVSGVDSVVPQFAGVLTKQPRIDLREKRVQLEAADFIDFFQNRFLDQSVMFTGQRTDQVLETLFNQMGMSTSQYVLDTGINNIPFGIFEAGSKFSDVVNELVEAEAGHLYQDEEGIFRFENRQHWDSSPHNAVQKLLLTGQVISAEAPNDDHIINVVEIKSKIRSKKPEQTIFRLSSLDSIQVDGSSTAQAFVSFDSPALSMTTPTAGSDTSFFKANTAADASGDDATASVSITSVDRFANSAKITFSNSSATTVYIHELVITGRTATVDRELYHRSEDDSSLTAYEEQPFEIDNPYIQSESWANSLAQMILNDFSDPENLQRITIRAIPELQLGDLVSWQGRYWRIFDIKSQLSASTGFIQELTMLQRTISAYFRIGISTIGGTDKIAP